MTDHPVPPVTTLVFSTPQAAEAQRFFVAAQRKPTSGVSYHQANRLASFITWISGGADDLDPPARTWPCKIVRAGTRWCVEVTLPNGTVLYLAKRDDVNRLFSKQDWPAFPGQQPAGVAVVSE